MFVIEASERPIPHPQVRTLLWKSTASALRAIPFILRKYLRNLRKQRKKLKILRKHKFTQQFEKKKDIEVLCCVE